MQRVSLQNDFTCPTTRIAGHRLQSRSAIRWTVIPLVLAECASPVRSAGVSMAEQKSILPTSPAESGDWVGCKMYSFQWTKQPHFWGAVSFRPDRPDGGAGRSRQTGETAEKEEVCRPLFLVWLAKITPGRSLREVSIKIDCADS